MKVKFKPIFILLVGITLLLTAKLSYAKVDLFEIPKAYLYPKVYSPERIVVVQDYEELEQDLKTNGTTLNAYVLASQTDTPVGLTPVVQSQTTNINIMYKQLTPEKYLISVPESPKSLIIVLNESFHGAWRLGLLTNQPLDCNTKVEVIRSSARACTATPNGVLSDVLFTLKNKPTLVPSTHFVANGLMNAWYIPNAEKGTYIAYFKVQNYFYLGVLISLTTVIIPLAYLIYTYFQPKVKKFNHE